jgi:hypothetical protein
MNTMNTSLMMDKIGMTVVHAFLLAGLPVAAVATLIQFF